jgi:hypothetical protein
MKKLLLLIPVLFALSCKQKASDTAEGKKLNKLAQEYVTLGLTIGQYDEDFVDAYYGPDSLRPDSNIKDEVFPKDSLLANVNELMNELRTESRAATIDSNKMRADWMYNQLIAFGRRIRIFSEEYRSFDEESKDLFGVTAPVYDEDYFKKQIDELDSLLPGKGNVNDRFQKLANKFAIPKDKLDAVMKAAIAEARKRTLAHYAAQRRKLYAGICRPINHGTGYNWYKGKYQSIVQINTDTKIFIDRAIDVGSHESYPGHHVYNMLLEKNLYHDKGRVEISLYPLFSPQSLNCRGQRQLWYRSGFPRR